ncbi:hypothetical protein CH249_14115 [Rhodococcus sp. 05-2255-3B1]|uniref:hypothetical protein n=1 Tax=unclassified Rhodococcus (in: high G+C Gram-positive bacteria) TaxID=192944 RepID=UPI000B9ADE32|nr:MULTISPECIES: hypothetical protein [unclassified Rhodococcus (in: high G+C Gram-positive bacteria)]OZE10215.1 hypothetical protein CH249_14115 [Rhodococcus sp. 05-2255-3B1]OZE13615.1 hypothetical protein CH250_07020 [Rhodococcus sp. 05-2255-3C]OZE13702.1 hypothetical protein CH255_23825 [Rhodococcus sp. 05-2255-2A2]
MTWKVISQTDPERWLESTGGIDFAADAETTYELGDLGRFVYPLTPVGPGVHGVRTPSELFGAAWFLIPSPQVAGDHPPYPDIPNDPDVIY